MLKGLLLSFTCIFFAEYTMAIEEPKYTVIEAFATAAIEVRMPHVTRQLSILFTMMPTPVCTRARMVRMYS